MRAQIPTRESERGLAHSKSAARATEREAAYVPKADFCFGTAHFVWLPVKSDLAAGDSSDMNKAKLPARAQRIQGQVARFRLRFPLLWTMD